MDPQVTAAIIELAGALIVTLFTIILSVVLSLRQTKMELRKAKTEIAGATSDQLLKERLRVYPELYKLLSDFDKAIRFGTAQSPEIYNRDATVPPTIQITPLPQEVVRKLFQDVLNWDSRHAVLLSGFAGGVLHAFRLVLFSVISLAEEQYLREYGTPNSLKYLLENANNLEMTIKSDLGIFDVEFLESDKPAYTYENIREHILKKYNTKF